MESGEERLTLELNVSGKYDRVYANTYIGDVQFAADRASLSLCWLDLDAGKEIITEKNA